MEKTIAAMQEQIKTLFKNFSEVKGMQNSLHELVIELKVMNSEMRELRKDMEEFRADVNEIKNKPARRWDGIQQTATAASVGAVITYIMMKLGLGS